MICRTCLVALAVLGILLPPGARAAEPPPRAERLRWYQEAKLGVCFHWGLYSVLGEGEWVMSRKKMRPAEYEKLAEQFQPAEFRAKEWVDLVKRAGARYVVFVVKHHDGFCLFDSKLTDYTVTKATPLKRDVLRELADECRKQGLKFGVAYSILDWHHPDFLPTPAWDRDNPQRAGANSAGYLRYVEGQVRELCGGYGKLDLFWWEGGWHHTDETSQKEFARLNGVIRDLQPHILINHQGGAADDLGTPEQPVPRMGWAGKDGQPIPWEKSLALTTSQDGSSYTKKETSFRTPADLIQTLADTASRGGNLLLHVGPQPSGKVQKEVAESLAGLGRWLSTNGEAVYGASASPLRHLGFWGRATRKADTLYLHVFHWPGDGLFLLPGMNADLVETGRVKATLLGSPRVPVSPLFRPTPEPVYGVRAGGGTPPGVVPVLKLHFTRWPRLTPAALRPNADGALVLALRHADLAGDRCRLEASDKELVLTGWGRREDQLRWEFEVPLAAAYDVVVEYACAPGSAGGEVAAAVERNEVRARVQATGSEAAFREQTVGRLYLGAGVQTLSLRPISIPKGKELMRLRGVVLRPVK